MILMFVVLAIKYKSSKEKDVFAVPGSEVGVIEERTGVTVA